MYTTNKIEHIQLRYCESCMTYTWQKFIKNGTKCDCGHDNTWFRFIKKTMSKAKAC